jgi:hypothetical protein
LPELKAMTTPSSPGQPSKGLAAILDENTVRVLGSIYVQGGCSSASSRVLSHVVRLESDVLVMQWGVVVFHGGDLDLGDRVHVAQLTS